MSRREVKPTATGSQATKPSPMQAKPALQTADVAAASPNFWKSLIECRAAGYLAWLFILVPMAMGFLFVYIYGTNICWEDQISSVGPLFAKWYDGSLGFADFWRQNNEHRHFVPTLAMFGLGVLTKWNTLAEMYLIQCTFAAALGINIYAYFRQHGWQRSQWTAVPIAFLVFSLRQNQNMLEGYQFGFVSTAVEAMAAFLCLHLMQDGERLLAKFLAALAFATLATFSAAQGLLTWPVGLLQLLVLPVSQRAKGIFSVVWLATSAVEAAVYFWNFARPGYLPDKTFTIDYFLAYIGAALIPARMIAIIAGGAVLVLVLAATTYCLVSRGAQRNSYWLALIAFGLAIALETTLGRSGFGSVQALSSRYATFSIVPVIGAYGILSALRFQGRSRVISASWYCLLGLILVGVTLSMLDGYQVGTSLRKTEEYHVFVFRTYDTQPDDALRREAGPTGPEIRPILDFLKGRRWNVFADDAAVRSYSLPPNLPTAQISAIAPLPDFGVNPRNQCEAVDGWAVDGKSKSPAGGVFLEIDGICYPTYYGCRRDDAVETLRSNKALRSGYLREFSAQQVPPGKHRIALKVLSTDRSGLLQTPPAVEIDVGG